MARARAIARDVGRANVFFSRENERCVITGHRSAESIAPANLVLHNQAQLFVHSWKLDQSPS